MTERKTELPSIFRRPSAGNTPAPWTPPELPAAKAPASAKRDRPWVPAARPSSLSKDVPAVATRDRPKPERKKPWVPAAEAPRNLPAAVNDDSSKTPEPLTGEILPAETVSGNPGGSQTTIIIQQVIAPQPVYVVPWACEHWNCPQRAGFLCRSLFCWRRWW